MTFLFIRFKRYNIFLFSLILIVEVLLAIISGYFLCLLFKTPYFNTIGLGLIMFIVYTCHEIMMFFSCISEELFKE